MHIECVRGSKNSRANRSLVDVSTFVHGSGFRSARFGIFELHLVSVDVPVDPPANSRAKSCRRGTSPCRKPGGIAERETALYPGEMFLNVSPADCVHGFCI